MAAVRRRPENVIQALLLSAVGGYLDAFTFVGQGGVFANAQTGNVVLGASAAARGDWSAAADRLPALGAFAVGVLVTLALPRAAGPRRVYRPTRIVLVVEVIVLAAVGAAPQGSSRLLITAAVAFVASLQVSTFRRVGETAYSSTLSTGNLRSLLEATYTWLARRDSDQRGPAVRLGLVMLGFAVGAAAGALLTRSLHDEAAWIAAGLLLAVLGAIVAQTERMEQVGHSDHA